MDKKEHKAWQKFEKEQDISNKHPELSQIIFMAFEAGVKVYKPKDKPNAQ